MPIATSAPTSTTDDAVSENSPQPRPAPTRNAAPSARPKSPASHRRERLSTSAPMAMHAIKLSMPSSRKLMNHLTPCLSLRQREREQPAALAGSQHPGEEALGPRAPPGRHGDVLPSVDAVGRRAAVVTAAALEMPQQLPGVGVEGVVLPGRLTAEHQTAAGGQQRRAHRDVV